MVTKIEELVSYAQTQGFDRNDFQKTYELEQDCWGVFHFRGCLKLAPKAKHCSKTLSEFSLFACPSCCTINRIDEIAFIEKIKDSQEWLYNSNHVNGHAAVRSAFETIVIIDPFTRTAELEKSFSAWLQSMLTELAQKARSLASELERPSWFREEPELDNSGWQFWELWTLDFNASMAAFLSEAILTSRGWFFKVPSAKWPHPSIKADDDVDLKKVVETFEALVRSSPCREAAEAAFALEK